VGKAEAAATPGPLTRDSLQGVWAAIATPFDDDDRIDFGIFRENLARLTSAGVHGIYTTDSDGEFYGVEIGEFEALVKVFAAEARRLKVATQVGVTWCNTAGTLARLRIAAHSGILGAHVGHPCFMPMTTDSYRQFWDDVQATVPEQFALIHYNTPRLPNQLGAGDYRALGDRVPSLLGTKHVGSDFAVFCDLISAAPGLSHFVSEHSFTPFSLFGARGIYSWFVNFNPAYMLDWRAELQAGHWESARHRQRRMSDFIRAMDVFLAPGNLHAAVTKAVSAASEFLIPSLRTRRPYLPVPDTLVREFRGTVERDFPDLAWTGP
jgi:dihydrodipicolinate synthase/N-acetylneuraminate lyase